MVIRVAGYEDSNLASNQVTGVLRASHMTTQFLFADRFRPHLPDFSINSSIYSYRDRRRRGVSNKPAYLSSDVMGHTLIYLQFGEICAGSRHVPACLPTPHLFLPRNQDVSDLGSLLREILHSSL